MIEWSRTPQNEPWARWQQRAVCSSRDPRKEAAQWVDSLNLRPGDKALVVLGVGVAYHLSELVARFPDLKIVALDSKSELVKQARAARGADWPSAVEFVIGEEAVQEFAKRAPTATLRRFRSACFEFEDVIFQELLGQSVAAFRRIAARGEYDFLPAIDQIPESLAVNVKSLNVEALNPAGREARLLRALKELIR